MTAVNWRDGIEPCSQGDLDKTLLRRLTDGQPEVYLPLLMQIGNEVNPTEPIAETRREARILFARKLQGGGIGFWYQREARYLWPESIAFFAMNQQHADLPHAEAKHVREHLRWGLEHEFSPSNRERTPVIVSNFVHAFVYAHDLEAVLRYQLYDAIPVIYDLLCEDLRRRGLRRIPSPPESVMFKFAQRGHVAAHSTDEGERVRRDLLRVNLVCGLHFRVLLQREPRIRMKELAATLMDLVASSIDYFHPLLDSLVAPTATPTAIG